MILARATFRHFVFLLGGLCAAALPALAVSDLHTSDDIYERVVSLVGKDKQKLTFFVKLPPGVSNVSEIKGVFAFCTWESDPAQIRQVMTDSDPGGTTGRIAKFAFDHQMAIVSWTTFRSTKDYDRGKNFDDMTDLEAERINEGFNQIATTWKSGVDSLIRDYHLPAKNWFLYGMSGGAQWAHRIVLRKPDMFYAVHIHINSSYDKPGPQASKVLWLVTTGELEAGYPYSKRFYAACRALNYPIIYNAEAKLGHNNSPGIDRLSNAFFEYAWARLQGQDTGSERFVGNYETHEYVPVSQAARVPGDVQVYLPTRAIADAWGMAADAGS